MKDLKPIDILEETIMYGFMQGKMARHKKPGSIIERMPEERRKILRKLTSDDALNIRLYKGEVSE